MTALVATCRFLREHTACRVVVDPFCGHGTVLAVANEFGLDAVGVELSAKRARKARRMTTRDGEADRGNVEPA
jgi:tRNA G10  N-methylase Trm11